MAQIDINSFSFAETTPSNFVIAAETVLFDLPSQDRKIVLPKSPSRSSSSSNRHRVAAAVSHRNLRLPSLLFLFSLYHVSFPSVPSVY